MNETICPEEVNPIAAETESPKLDPKVAPGSVLARLIEEVRYERAEGPLAYNRMHNRHNRSR